MNVGAVLLDLSKAFDTLNHAILIDKLESYGICGVELRWFQDYLFNRSQRVSYDNMLSEKSEVYCGVPQGSILGPLLFIVYFNDFVTCLKHSKVTIYADDTVVYVAGKDTYIIESRLSSDMQSISKWCEINQLILNLGKGKIESMLLEQRKPYLNSQILCILHITVALLHLHYCTVKYKYLGIEITPTLNMNLHANCSFQKACDRLRLLRKIRPLLTPTAAENIYRSTIIPILTYCGNLLYISNKTANKLCHCMLVPVASSQEIATMCCHYKITFKSIPLTNLSSDEKVYKWRHL